MHGRNTTLFTDVVNNAPNMFIHTIFGLRKMSLRPPCRMGSKRRRLAPGVLPRLTTVNAALLQHSTVISQRIGDATGASAQPATSCQRLGHLKRPLVKVSEDPLLHQTRMLLEASRRLREQPLPMSSVDQETTCCSSTSLSDPSSDSISRHTTFRSASSYTCEGYWAAVSTTTAECVTAGPCTVPTNAAIASATAAPEPAGPSAALRVTQSALTIAAASTASIAAASALLPPAAIASGSAVGLSGAAAAAASAASSGWLAIEELLEEAAYSLSQEIPDARDPSPLDRLLASAEGFNGSGSSTGLDLGLPQQLNQPITFLGSKPGVSTPSGLLEAVPGGDRLSEMFNDLLYSLSLDVNLGATQEAVISAASAAVAGLAGAVAELPRAAESVYRSAASAAASAAAARAAAAQASSGGGSGGTAFVVPDEIQEVVQLDAWDEYDDTREEYDLDVGSAGGISADTTNPPWDPYGTTSAAEAIPITAFEAGGGDAITSSAVAVIDSTLAELPPISSTSAAQAGAEAATATAAVVVEAAATTTDKNLLITPLLADPTAALAERAVTTAAPSAAASDGTATVIDAAGSGGGLYGMDVNEMNVEDVPEVDELATALKNLLAAAERLPASDMDLSAAAAGLDAADAPQLLATDGAAVEAALSGLTEALQLELGAVLAGGTVASDAAAPDPTYLAKSAGQALSAALSSLSPEQQVDMAALPQDVRLSSVLGATLQSSLDLLEIALSGIRSADSTLVGGVTIAVVLALLIRAVVSLAGSALNRSRDGAAAAANSGAASGSESRLRAEGVTALEAAAALNNDPQVLLLDIRNDSDVLEQGLPDLRPFRRGVGASTVSLPYCDFRTIPTLTNPSGFVRAGQAAAAADRTGNRGKKAAADGGRPGASSSLSLVTLNGRITVAVDPMFISKFKQLEGLTRDSRVFLLDSYGVEAPEAVLRLRSDPEIDRLLGLQGVKYVEGGFAGPEGWKLTGLPVMDAPQLTMEGPNGSPGLPIGLDLSGLVSSVAALRVRYPSLFSRALAVGALGGGGLVVASSLDWGLVTRGTVGLAAAMLLADRALPPAMKPSGRIRQYLQSQLSDPQLEAASQGATASDLTSHRRRTALLLRALDLVEAVGDAVVRAGGAAVTAVGSGALGTISGRSAVPTGVMNGAEVVVEAELHTPSPPTPAPADSRGGSTAAATIVLPHGMNSPQWSAAAERAVAQSHHHLHLDQPPPPPLQQQQERAAVSPRTESSKQPRVASPLPPNWLRGPSVVDSSSPTFNASAAASGSQPRAASRSELLPRTSSSPSLADQLSSALRTATDAVVRAASPARAAGGPVAAASGRAASPQSGGGGGSPSRPDTLELMKALATASALSSMDSTLLPGWPAMSFPKASAGQEPSPPPQQQSTPTAAGDEGVDEALGQDTICWSGAASSLSSSWRETAAPASQSSGEPVVASQSAATAEADLWSQWQQELATVTPSLSQMSNDDQVSNSRGDNQSLYDNTTGVTIGSLRDEPTDSSWRWGGRLTLEEGPTGSNWNAAAVEVSSSISSKSGAASSQQQQHSQTQHPHPRGRQPLQTSSPERAAAAGAALRRLRIQLDNRDDDGLGSGALGGGDSFVSTFDHKNRDGDGRVTTPAGASEACERPSGGVAHSNGRQWAVGSSSVRQKQPLYPSSVERAAGTTASMRQLRVEMGLPPNDSFDDSHKQVTPRDWRQELQAAAAPMPVGSDSESAVATTTFRAPRLSGESRLQLEGHGRQAYSDNGGTPSSSKAPADWRARIEGGDSSGFGNGSSSVQVPHGSVGSSTASPGRVTLTAAERAARNARLRDWRARV